MSTAQASFALRGRNPDVLTCIANLSNDEVFTPPELANQMLDALAEAWSADNDGANIWADTNVKFLDPFFVEVLSMVFRPRSDHEPDQPTEQEKAAAENAFRLLHSWSTCPAIDDQGEVTLERLRDWVSTARFLLAERKRVEIGDEQIGQALASAPADPDGSWPCQPVRDLLEELQNDRIDRGLEIRVFNNRGVTSRSLEEGGQQEWKLAEGYRERAEQCVSRWPRTATIYRRLAETYEADACREDAEAERRSRGLDA